MAFFPDRCPQDVLLPSAARSSVVVVYDAILNRHPEYHASEEEFLWYTKFVRTLVASADRLICFSESSADEAVNDLGAVRENIVASTLSVDPSMTNPLPLEEVNHRVLGHGIVGDYFVALGKDYPHKDHATLYRALGRLKGDTGLVCIGSRVWDRGDEQESLDHLAAELEIANRVFWREGLADDDLKALLQGSKGLVFPSWEEGFGLPPLEAMNLEVPVIAASSMSIPEVCGDAALFFKAGDDEKLAVHMQDMLDDEEVGKDLIERGRERASQFTWAKCVDGVIDSYRQAIEKADRSRETSHAQSLTEILDVVSSAPFRAEGEVNEWRERCRDAEQHAWRLEDHRDEMVDRLRELEKRCAHLERHVRNVERNRDEVLVALKHAEEGRVAAEAALSELEKEHAGVRKGLFGKDNSGEGWSMRHRIGKIRKVRRGRVT